MAEVRGRKCDRPDCTTFEPEARDIPVGWIVTHIKTEKPDDKPYELCSNRCAAILFLDRYEAESGGKRLVRQGKGKGRDDATTRPSNS